MLYFFTHYAHPCKMTGEDLRKARTALGLTQKEFAEVSGYRRETIVAYEAAEGPLSKRTQAAIKTAIENVKKNNMARNEAQSKLRKSVKELNLKGFVSEPIPDLNSKQMSMAIMTTAATSAASLEMLSEVLSIVSKGSLDEAKEKARKLAQEKGLTLNYVLGILL